MGIIREHISFERGLEPKDAMQTGDPQQKIEYAIKTALLDIMKSLGVNESWLEDWTGKNRIAFHFPYKGDDYYITYELPYDPGQDEYAVGWFKKDPKTVSGNGDEVYTNNLKTCIDYIKEWTDNPYITLTGKKRSKKIRENYNFERTKDPKKAMNTGYKLTDHIWKLQFINGIGAINITRSADEVWFKVDTIGINEDEFNEYMKKYFEKDMFQKINIRYGKGWFVYYSMLVNPKYNQLFLDAVTKDGFIKESQNFKRGLDPKISMGTGIEEEIIRYIEQRNGTKDINDIRDRLLFCAIDGKEEYVDYILTHLNSYDITNLNLALQWAASAGHLSIVKKLIKAGANPTADNCLALSWASQEQPKIDVVKFLLQFDCKEASWHNIIKNTIDNNVRELLKKEYEKYKKYI